MVLEIIQREIATKGVGYMILRDCPEERLGEALGRGMEKLKRAGARRVWATSLPEGEPLHPGPVGLWRLSHVHDILWMVCTTGNIPRPSVKISTRPLKKAADDKCWIELMNRAFRDVPGARTIEASSVRRPNHRCGLGWAGNKLVGAYEVDLSDKVPELAALAIDPELWRQGYGRNLLLTLLDGMKKMGKCGLRLSSLNAPALALCQEVGFQSTGVLESWFEVV